MTESLLGHVDIVASAEGKIIPSTRVKQIQPLEKGIIKTILVAEGQGLVVKGQSVIKRQPLLIIHKKRMLLGMSPSEV